MEFKTVCGRPRSLQVWPKNHPWEKEIPFQFHDSLKWVANATYFTQKTDRFE